MHLLFRYKKFRIPYRVKTLRKDATKKRNSLFRENQDKKRIYLQEIK